MSFSVLKGDYAVRGGLLTINETVMEGEAKVRAAGTMNLPAETLNLLVRVEPPQPFFPVEADVTGTFEKQDVKPRITRAVVEGVGNIIKNSGNLLEKIIKPRQ